MKLNVKIGEKTYSVEIEDLNARPIVAVVDGERFEVIPENGQQVQAEKKPSERVEVATRKTETASPASNARILPAPLPGTVTEIFVKPGDEIISGQVVLVIEAMKMKNSIRSVRDGIVAALLATAGQTVTHKQPLLEFE